MVAIDRLGCRLPRIIPSLPVHFGLTKPLRKTGSRTENRKQRQRDPIGFGFRLWKPGFVNAKLLWQMGHLRWENENNGRNDLTQNRMLKHGFLHACRYRVKTNNPGGGQDAGRSLDALCHVCPIYGFQVASLQVLSGSQNHVPGSGTRTLSLYGAESAGDSSSGRGGARSEPSLLLKG